MPRGTKDDMQVNVAGLRRNIKNLAHNYSDAQIKVREATSNDPWGPSSTLMAEIADLTYNVMAFTEIMQMIWKRLNDHGKNWRHVYKALVLMEYLIKTGTEKVAMQCKENIFAIHTLKDFQCLEDGRDQGLNVREKAKQLFILLKDDERLKNERARALKAKERFAQSASAFGSDGALETPSSPAFPTMGGSSRDRDGAWCGSGSGSVASAVALGELETARPQTAGEEELQLQLALAVSREEAERDERRRRSDNVRLQLALSQSEQDFKCPISEFPFKIHHVQPSIESEEDLESSPILLDGNKNFFEINFHLKNNRFNAGAVHEKYSQQEDIPVFTFLQGTNSYSKTNVSNTDDFRVAPGESRSKGDTPQQSHLLDLLDVNVGNPMVHDNATASGPLDPWGAPPTPPQRPQTLDVGFEVYFEPMQQSVDPWSSSTASPPGAGSPPARPDPWAPTQPPLPPAPVLALTNKDPWAPLPQTMSQSPLQNILSSPSSDLEFDIITNRSRSAQQNGSSYNINNNHSNGGTLSPDPFDLTLLGDHMSAPNANSTGFPPKKTPQSFLGENSALVNLDNLIKPTNGTGNEPLFGVSTVSSLAHLPANPFTPEVQQSRPNLFQNQAQPRLTMNEIKQQPFATASVDQDPWAPAPAANSPWAPVSSNPKSTTPNPFLS